MKTNTTPTYALIAATLLASNLSTGCDSETEQLPHRDASAQVENQIDVDSLPLLAEADIDDVHFRFVETSPYGVLVTASTPLDNQSNIPQEYYEDIGALELYESLTLTPAPLALVDASMRALELEENEIQFDRITTTEPSNIETKSTSDVADQSFRISASSFLNICQARVDSWGAGTCKTYRTCTSNNCEYFDSRVATLWASAYPYRGSIELRIRIRSLSGLYWKTTVSMDLDQGEYNVLKSPSYSVRRRMEFDLRDGKGNGYHVGAMGLK